MRRRVSQLSPAWYLVLVLFNLLPVPARAQDPLLLPAGRLGAPYSAQIKSEGGMAPLSWRVSGGQLPPGLAVSSAGKIDGTPTAAAKQPFTFELTVSDSSEPPQSAVQRFSIIIGAPQLRIVGSENAPEAAPLRIIAPSKSVSTDKDRPPKLEPQKLIVEPISYSLPRQPHFVVPLQSTPPPLASPKTDVTQTPVTHEDEQTTTLGPLDPATFIRVYEDPKAGGRRSIYTPVKTLVKNNIQLVADYESSIIIVPDGKEMGEDVAFNKLYITAKLTSGNSSKDVVVNGYSEVGKDQATMASQGGTAFQSAANVQAMVLNMAYTASEIIDTLYQQPPTKTITPTEEIDFGTWRSNHQEIDFRSTDAKTITDSIANAKDLTGEKDLVKLRARLRLYQPEIQAISDFLVQKENLELVEKLGVKIFWIDRDSMVAIAQQYKDDIQIAFDPKSASDAQLRALQDLLERTKLVYGDFGDIRQTIMANLEKDTDKHTDEQWQRKYEQYLQKYAEGK
jgi:hypothetical protein